MDKKKDKILVVDDDPKLLSTMKRTLELAGYAVATADDGERAKHSCRTENPQALLLDIGLPSASGWDVLEWVAREYPILPVIMITADGSIEKAVKAIKMGAYDFLEKPIDTEELRIRLRNAIEKNKLENERSGLLQSLQAQHEMLGESRAMRALKSAIDRIAPTDEKVLIVGESGTGKELVAKAIYSRSRRASKPLVKVNCAAIPKELIESELFGHKKGSFTGAVSDNDGKFKQAHGGTIFLDEIGDMGADVQAKVLRALQEGEIEPVGGRVEQVDVRVIAATNHDLQKRMKEGNFRPDLYYRLSAVVIDVPPLRERVEDIPLLMSHFLVREADKHNRLPLVLEPNVMDCLLAYPWPGNVRELKGLSSRLSILCEGPAVTDGDLPSEFRSHASVASPEGLPDFDSDKEQWEREYLRRQLILVDNNISELARRLNRDRAGLQRRLKSLGIVD